MTKQDALDYLEKLFPESSLALREAALAPHLFRRGAWWELDDDALSGGPFGGDVAMYIHKELTALDWVKNNPISSLKAIVRDARKRGDDLGELDVALLTLAATYEKWARSRPSYADPEKQGAIEEATKKAGAFAKAKRLREIVDAL